MPEHLTDCIITKVYTGPSGESEYGPWQVYNLYLDKGDKKFGYMHSGKKPIPKEGMEIKHIEYELETTQKDGKTYENYKIKKMEVAEEKSSTSKTSTQTTSHPTSNNKDASYYVAYAKDIAVAMLNDDPDAAYEVGKVETIALEVTSIGLKMLALVNKDTPQNTPSESPEWVQGASRPKAEGTTLSVENEELSTKLQNYALLDKKKYFEVLKQHGATRASEVFEFATDAQVSLLNDLEKELGDIPF